MKKKILHRCLIGAPIGLAISTLITIVISLIVGDGRYYAVVPEAVSDFGTEINAVLAQAVFSMLYGAAFAGASAVWETDWSLLRMTLTHLVICSAATFPIAYGMRWMEHSPGGVLKYVGIFVAIYALIWIVMYGGIKRKIKAMNERVREIK